MINQEVNQWERGTMKSMVKSRGKLKCKNSKKCELNRRYLGAEEDFSTISSNSNSINQLIHESFLILRYHPTLSSEMSSIQLMFFELLHFNLQS